LVRKRQQKRDSPYRRVLRVTRQGIVVNAALGTLKLAAGLLAGSGALVADGFHSLSDLASDGLVLWGTSVASWPEDADHPYGHGRIETLVGGLVGLMLILLAVGIGWGALHALRSAPPPPPSWWALVVAAGSFGVKEWLFRITVAAGKQERSLAALANAWHHRSDAFSSLAVMAGIATAIMAWPRADSVAALAVALLIGWVGGTISLQAGRQLVDTVVDPAIIARVRRASEATEGVRSVHDVRARTMGNRFLADLHIEVEGTLTVEAAHTIAEQVEANIMEEMPHVAHVIVHVDPWRGGP
jgi:cation diffusion facilitator family transporter